VHRWRRRNRSHKTGVRGKTAPDAATEYLLYQTLIGIWPAPDPRSLETTFPDAEALNELCERVEQYMLKAAREAKMRTSWVQGDAEYEQALVNFVRGVMSLDQNSSSAFLKDLHSFVGRIARPGFWNALSRTLIQFTAPGTPDTYQGDELWNLALVDPDNRRPVDYERRRKLLDEILTGIEGPAEARRELIQSLVASPEDGRIKLHVVRTALNTRRQHRQLFFTGDYQPLEVEGAAKEHLFGFTRTTDTEAALILVPRFTTSLVSDAASAPIGPEVWKDTAIHLPDRFDNCEWRSELTAEPVAVSCGAASSVLRAADVLHDFPVALLVAKLPNSVQEVA
jgi:(1->4)-alpha-D-glucan 1-alpha-D-glucosylmutase